MAEGKPKSQYVGQEGQVRSADSPNWDFIYQTSLVKDPDHDIGDRVVLGDGREFRYAKSVAACVGTQAAEFTYTGYVAYTAFVVAASVGDSEVTVPAATHAALAADELRGGYLLIFHSGGQQLRGIVGNDAADANALFKVRLDGSLVTAVTASSAAEVYQNPYAALQTGAGVATPKAGLPASAVTAALTYFWVQTRGICWIAPQTSVEDNGGVGVCFRHDGSLEGTETALGGTVPTNDTSQIAGFRVTGSAAGNGPLVFLTL